MTVCPICLEINPHETQQCRKLNGEPVCVECCKKCKHHTSIYRCGYRVEDPTAALRIKVGEINLEINRKEGLRNWLYKTNLPRRAEEVDWEISALKKKRKELEDQCKRESGLQ